MAESEEGRTVEVEESNGLESENPTLDEIPGTKNPPPTSTTTTTTTSRNEEVEDQNREEEKLNLFTLFQRLFGVVFFPEDGDYKPSHLLERIKKSIYENGPLLREASMSSTKDLLHWTRQGSPLRALLVISVGAITLLALTGLMVFMLFFLAATINAVIISLFVSLAVAGGFLAMFFASVTAVYIGALSVAFVVISTAVITTTIAVVIVTGWAAFFYSIWWVTKKSFGFAEHTLYLTTSAVSAYSAGRRAHNHEHDKLNSVE